MEQPAGRLSEKMMEREAEVRYAHRQGFAAQAANTGIANSAWRCIEGLAAGALANGRIAAVAPSGLEPRVVAEEFYAAGFTASMQAVKQPWA